MADIKDKIKKLLALATSPNENEARDALLKARELMAKNKLSDADFDEKKTELRQLECSEIKWTTDSGDIWMANLCKVIADNYCCSAAWSTVKGGRTHTLVLAGIGEDVDLCKEVTKYAVDFINSAVRILERKSRNDHRTVVKSYAEGFIMGLEFAFEEQKDDHPEWALVIIKPQEVQEYEKDLGSRSVKTKKADFDPLAYMRGQNDGKNFSMTNKLGMKEAI